jgi:hypothetical protein
VFSRENAVVVLCATTALVLAYGGRVVTSLSDTVLIGVVILVGVVIPQAVNSYLDDGNGD